MEARIPAKNVQAAIHSLLSGYLIFWIDYAVFLARTRADNAARAHADWQRSTRQVLAREHHLLTRILGVIEHDDRVMRQAILDGGIASAMRRMTERDAMDEQEILRIEREDLDQEIGNYVSKDRLENEVRLT